jgi:hypothetical protein
VRKKKINLKKLINKIFLKDALQDFREVKEIDIDSSEKDEPEENNKPDKNLVENRISMDNVDNSSQYEIDVENSKDDEVDDKISDDSIEDVNIRITQHNSGIKKSYTNIGNSVHFPKSNLLFDDSDEENKDTEIFQQKTKKNYNYNAFPNLLVTPENQNRRFSTANKSYTPLSYKASAVKRVDED